MGLYTSDGTAKAATSRNTFQESVYPTDRVGATGGRVLTSAALGTTGAACSRANGAHLLVGERADVVVIGHVHLPERRSVGFQQRTNQSRRWHSGAGNAWLAFTGAPSCWQEGVTPYARRRHGIQLGAVAAGDRQQPGRQFAATVRGGGVS